MKKVIILVIVVIVIITSIVAIAINKNSKDSNTGNNIRNEIQQEEMPQDNIDMKEPSSSEQVGL